MCLLIMHISKGSCLIEQALMTSQTCLATIFLVIPETAINMSIWANRHMYKEKHLGKEQ